MLEEFADTLPIVLLFLRNVCKISIWEWRVDEKSPVILQEALISDMTSEVRLKRSLRYTSVAFSAQSTRSFSAEGSVALLHNLTIPTLMYPPTSVYSSQELCMITH